MKVVKYILLFALTVNTIEESSPSESFTSYGPCTPSNASAKMAVEFFLEATHLEDFRVETGTTNVKVSEIQHVDDPAVCQKLLDMVNANRSLQNSDTERTLYFYRTDNFFFIFYDFNKIRTGYTDFNVISSDFKILGLYLI